MTLKYAKISKFSDPQGSSFKVHHPWIIRKLGFQFRENLIMRYRWTRWWRTHARTHARTNGRTRPIIRFHFVDRRSGILKSVLSVRSSVRVSVSTLFTYNALSDSHETQILASLWSRGDAPFYGILKFWKLTPGGSKHFKIIVNFCIITLFT